VRLLAGLGRPSGVLVAIPLCISRCGAGAPPRWSYSSRLSACWAIGAGYAGRTPSVVEAYRCTRDGDRSALGGHVGIAASAHRATRCASRHPARSHRPSVALSLRHEVRLEDKLFALAVVLQMLLYAGRPAVGAVRYLLPVYPAFLALGSYAQSH